MTDASELQSILNAWADLIEETHPDRRSAVSVHARAAADRIRRLERVATAAARMAEALAGETLSEAGAAPLLELRAALHLLDGRDHGGDGRTSGREARRSAH